MNGMLGICPGVDVDGCMSGSTFVAAVAVVSESVVFFDVRLRANDALNMGDSMGTFSYVEDPDLMACAQTRSRGRLRLKCKSDAR